MSKSGITGKIVEAVLTVALPLIVGFATHWNPWAVAFAFLIGVFLAIGVLVSWYRLTDRNPALDRAAGTVVHAATVCVLVAGAFAYQRQVNELEDSRRGTEERLRGTDARLRRLADDSTATANVTDPIRDRELRSARLHDDLENFIASGKALEYKFNGTPERPTPPYPDRVADLTKWNRAIMAWAKRNRLAIEQQDWESIQERYPITDSGGGGIQTDAALAERMQLLKEWQRKY